MPPKNPNSKKAQKGKKKEEKLTPVAPQEQAPAQAAHVDPVQETTIKPLKFGDIPIGQTAQERQQLKQSAYADFVRYLETKEAYIYGAINNRSDYADNLFKIIIANTPKEQYSKQDEKNLKTLLNTRDSGSVITRQSSQSGLKHLKDNKKILDAFNVETNELARIDEESAEKAEEKASKAALRPRGETMEEIKKLNEELIKKNEELIKERDETQKQREIAEAKTIEAEKSRAEEQKQREIAEAKTIEVEKSRAEEQKQREIAEAKTIEAERALKQKNDAITKIRNAPTAEARMEAAEEAAAEGEGAAAAGGGTAAPAPKPAAKRAPSEGEESDEDDDDGDGDGGGDTGKEFDDLMTQAYKKNNKPNKKEDHVVSKKPDVTINKKEDHKVPQNTQNKYEIYMNRIRKLRGY
jgi:hypothetical protein